MASTLTELINRTSRRVSMTSGTGIQIYGEDAIAEMIQHKFDVLFSERFWPQFTSWETFALDGVNGVVTTSLTDKIKNLADIRVIYIEDTDTKITRVTPGNFNPLKLSGSRPQFFEGENSITFADRIFKVYPVTATGNLTLHYRTKPDDFNPDDIVNFDEQILILGAAYDFLEDDGTNPGATDKFKTLFEQRFNQLKLELDQQPIPLDSYNLNYTGFSVTRI